MSIDYSQKSLVECLQILSKTAGREMDVPVIEGLRNHLPHIGQWFDLDSRPLWLFEVIEILKSYCIDEPDDIDRLNIIRSRLELT